MYVLDMIQRRKKKNYFKAVIEAQKPLCVKLSRRVNFNEVDVMGIAWHGRYCQYFEEGAAALGRACGLSYGDYKDANLFAPIVQHHVDYHLPLWLDEEFIISASLMWNEGARLNTEFALIKLDGNVAASGYTVQMFINAETKEPCFDLPNLIKRCHEKWKSGEFACLQK